MKLIIFKNRLSDRYLAVKADTHMFLPDMKMWDRDTQLMTDDNLFSTHPLFKTQGYAEISKELLTHLFSVTAESQPSTGSGLKEEKHG